MGGHGDDGGGGGGSGSGTFILWAMCTTEVLAGDAAGASVGTFER